MSKKATLAFCPRVKGRKPHIGAYLFLLYRQYLNIFSSFQFSAVSAASASATSAASLSGSTIHVHLPQTLLGVLVRSERGHAGYKLPEVSVMFGLKSEISCAL